MYIVPHSAPAPSAAMTPRAAEPCAASWVEASARSVAPTHMAMVPPMHAGALAAGGAAQLAEEERAPEDAEEAVRVPEREGDAQADVADGVDGERVGDGPEAAGENGPDDEVRRLADVGANGGGALQQRGHTPAREEDAAHHDERDGDGAQPGGDELRGCLGGTEPGAGGDAAQEAGGAERPSARGEVGRARRSTADPVEDERAGGQDGDGDPELDVGEDRGQARARHESAQSYGVAAAVPWSCCTSAGRFWITMMRVAGLRMTITKVLPSGEIP